MNPPEQTRYDNFLLPSNWQTAVRSLVVTGATTRIADVGETFNPVCTGRPGA
jgi:hypothetical protein